MTENTQPENVSLSTVTATSEKFAFPATPQQKQLWFVDQLDPGNPAYNIPLAYELRGLVDAEPLDRSLHWVLNRRETFRTVFSFCGEKLLQVVSSEVQVRFNRVDLRAVPESSREAACRRAIDAASAYRFNLASGPLVRADLLLLEDSRSVLVFNFHHIILDQASVLQFADEFCLAYDCFKKGLAPEVKAPQLQYPDFSVWQEEQFEQPQFQVDLSDWVREFDSVNPSSVFPTDHPRPIVQAFTGREAKFSLTPGLSARIREFARTSKKSLYVTLLTFFDCLLARYSGQDDVVVGSPFSNRMISGLEDLMGCCMNTLPLRAKLGEAGTFRAALDVVHQSVLAAYGRQRVPLQLIVDKLEAERFPGMNPLFQSLFMFQEPPMMIKLEGLEITPLWIHNGTSKFDMTIWLWDSGERISGLWEYDTSLYEADTIDRLVLNFQTFVSAAMNEPDTAWRRLPLAAPQEVKLLTQEFNRTQRNWRNNSSFVDLLDQTAKAQPDAVALICDDEKVTYRELIHRAETLSRRLTSLGLKSGSLVGICVERSPDMVVAMIAILKSGGAYLPLDLAFPEQRLSFMIEDSGLAFIVTSSNAVGQLPPHRARTILVDEKIAPTQTPMESIVQPDGDSLAYVRYTSGSTGRPKGVAISHQALLNFLRSMREQPGYTNRDVLLAVTTLSFDISELEIWLPLLCGGTIVLATRNQVIDGAELSRLIARHGVTVMQATPATWWLMIEAGWKGESRLKALCGGEALSPQLADGLVRRCAELWNMYGPTETTVWSSCSRINSIDDIHIGRPIANTELFVLDSYLEPVPIGVAGELFIGGDGLSHGYLNRPELTAEKFVPNPFKTRSRLYRTGDLARYRADGNLVCLGRLDQQVKLNGFRIELGEIESVLARVPGIKAAVVVLHQDQLIAYYVSESGHPVEVSTCREILRTWLPDYMMPAIFVPLETVPLTANGKVDRNALPSPNVSASSVSNVYAAPRTNTEQKMVAIWEEILQRSPIGIHDNFFDVGGHSLLAVTLFAKVERELGRRLPLASLFQNGTIAQLARLVETDREQKDQWESLVCIRQNRGAPGVFLIHGAGGNILIYLSLTRHLLDGVSVYGLQSPGLDGHKRPLRTIEEMAVSYVDEITRRQPVGPYVLAGYCMGGKIALEMARVLNERGQSVAMLAMLDTFNVNLANAANFRTSKLSYVCQMIMFHTSNLFAHGPQESWLYLREKVRQAHEVTAGFLSAIFNNFHLPQRNGSVGSKVVVQEFIQSVNDRAGFAYIPRSYSGPVTLFKPKRNYSVFSDPKMGWSEVLTGPLEIVELDMNPHAMLVEPFVQKPAAEINIRLCDLFKLRPSDDGNRAKPGVAHPTSHT